VKRCKFSNKKKRSYSIVIGTAAPTQQLPPPNSLARRHPHRYHAAMPKGAKMSTIPQHSSTKRYIADISIASSYDRYFAGTELFDYDSIMLERWLRHPGRLIDLGCGTGRHLLRFAAGDHDIVGVDLSAHMLAQARQKLTAAGLDAILIEADLTDLPITQAGMGGPLAASSFDYAICMFSTIGLINGSANRSQFLKSVLRLLKPQGQLVLHVHNRGHNVWSLEGWRFLLSNFIKSSLGRCELGDKIMPHYRGIDHMYLHVFTESEITNLLIAAGFQILQVKPLNNRRNGSLAYPSLRSITANGFLIRAKKPR
jgi:ubiquinone/menaquinone biosynthesis C-methylase UbiE